MIINHHRNICYDKIRYNKNKTKYQLNSTTVVFELEKYTLLEKNILRVIF